MVKFNHDIRNMPWIQNTSKIAVRAGFHPDAGSNSMLIQLSDPGTEFPIPKKFFKEIHGFHFSDVEENEKLLNEANRCTDVQVCGLIDLLVHALQENMNVIVHCHSGTSRSSAVCAVGARMGFVNRGIQDHPNQQLTQKLVECLHTRGYTITPNNI